MRVVTRGLEVVEPFPNILSPLFEISSINPNINITSFSLAGVAHAALAGF